MRIQAKPSSKKHIKCNGVAPKRSVLLFPEPPAGVRCGPQWIRLVFFGDLWYTEDADCQMKRGADMKRNKWSAVCLTVLIFGAFAAGGAEISAQSTEILVTDTASLLTALASASAGDEIVLREGVYQSETSSWKAFSAQADGTEKQPIILRSEDPEHPAEICGKAFSSQCALYITGSYWEIRDLMISSACKGIFLAKSEHSIISGCEVSGIGDEGIHIIDNSSYNLVEDCRIHDTGLLNPKYGEGVYIGSAKNATDYGFDCHYNTVRGCAFGPNVAADHVDIKEYTVGTLVENCTFDGTGIQGQNGGDSFVEIKGNYAVVRNNVGYRNGCEKQLYGFDLNMQTDGWGQYNQIYENTLYLDTTDCYVVKGWNCYAEVFRNHTEPADCTSYGNMILQIEEFQLAGDANGDGKLTYEDAVRLRDALTGKTVPFLSGPNSDLSPDGRLDAKDLALLKRKLLSGPVSDDLRLKVCFTQEGAGKWRMTDGLGGRDITFVLSAEAGTQLKLGWGYWDPDVQNADAGENGKWIQYSLGPVSPDADGMAEIQVSLPKNGRRLALEVWDYLDDSGKRDPGEVQLTAVLTP